MVCGMGDVEVNSTIEKLQSSKEASSDLAKDIVNELRDKILVVVGAEHLVGNAHIFANQLNETAKTISFFSFT